MQESLTVLLYRYPTFFRELGAAVCKVGGIGAMAGAIAELTKMAASIATGMAGQPPITSIASLLPGVWTGWIPETLAGVAMYVGFACLGAVLANASKHAQRRLRVL